MAWGRIGFLEEFVDNTIGNCYCGLNDRQNSILWAQCTSSMLSILLVHPINGMQTIKYLFDYIEDREADTKCEWHFTFCNGI